MINLLTRILAEGKMKKLIFLWASLYIYYKGELTMITINLNMVILFKRFTLSMN